MTGACARLLKKQCTGLTDTWLHAHNCQRNMCPKASIAKVISPAGMLTKWLHTKTRSKQIKCLSCLDICSVQLTATALFTINSFGLDFHPNGLRLLF
jgi:hypothetical protein